MHGICIICSNMLIIKTPQNLHQLIDPLTPRSDQHIISPYNITPESLIHVMRIKKMITN